jgi:hypothetical protein
MQAKNYAGVMSAVVLLDVVFIIFNIVIGHYYMIPVFLLTGGFKAMLGITAYRFMKQRELEC